MTPLRIGSIELDGWVTLGKQMEDAGVPLIELNFGCPHPKLMPGVRTGMNVGQDFDYACEITQAVAEAVGVPILTKREDIANARIRFENGCIANLTASRVTPVQKRKIRIFQDDAYIAINYDKQSMEVYRRVEPKDKSKGEKAEIVRKKMKIKLEDKLELELDHFLDCVIEGARPLVTGEQAIQALDAAVKISDQIRSTADEYFSKQK